MLVVARAPTDRGDERRPLIFDATQLFCLFYESITLSLACWPIGPPPQTVRSRISPTGRLRLKVLPLCNIFRINVNSNDVALFWLIAIVGAVDKGDASVRQGKP